MGPMPVRVHLAAAPRPAAAPRGKRAQTRCQRIGTGSAPPARELAAVAGARPEPPEPPRGPAAVGRRPLLLWTPPALLAAATPAAASAVRAATPLQVRPGGMDGAFATLSAAVAAAEPGATIVVAPGTYTDRLVLDKAVAIVASGDGVVVEHTTKNPYEATLQSTAVGARVEGISFCHSSPSIATNYGVFVQGGDLRLERCVLTSATGSALGVEGGAPTLVGCLLHGARRHGAAVFGDLLGGETVLDGCHVAGNALDGVLARDGAVVRLEGCTVVGNGGWGVELADAVGVLRGNRVRGNKKGSVLLSGSDPAAVQDNNHLDQPVAEI